jgi:hypothetical protein
MDKKFITTSIYMTAAFLALGAKLEDIDKTDPKHMIFSLSDGSTEPVVAFKLPDGNNDTSTITYTISEYNLSVWEKSWANGTLMVNAVKYMEAIQRLKSIVHSV